MEECAAGTSWVDTGDAAKYPTMHRRELPPNYQVQNVNNARLRNAGLEYDLRPSTKSLSYHWMQIKIELFKYTALAA